MSADDPKCTNCGHGSSLHVDGCEQCFDGECGCKEFEDDQDMELEAK